ncbi:hypothetical protein Tco_1276184 [Tanacetum coccineum]
MISQIKDRLKAARDRQKSYADKRRKPLEFSVGDYVLLKVSPWKCVVCFGKKGKLAPRFVRPFEIIEKVGPVAYMLDLPEELHGVHDTFHVSNLKKCLDDPTLQVPLDEVRVDDKLNFVEDGARSKNVCGEVGGVEKMSSARYKFMVRGEECLEGCVGACRGEVNRGRDDFGVSKSLLGEIPRVVIGESGGEVFGDDGGAV